MLVGALRVRLLLREARTLKDKRQVVQSIIGRLRNEFNVSVSEVDARDQVKTIVLGITNTGEEASHIQGVLQSIANALRGHPIAEYCDSDLEVTSLFDY